MQTWTSALLESDRVLRAAKHPPTSSAPCSRPELLHMFASAADTGTCSTRTLSFARRHNKDTAPWACKSFYIVQFFFQEDTFSAQGLRHLSIYSSLLEAESDRG